MRRQPKNWGTPLRNPLEAFKGRDFFRLTPQSPEVVFLHDAHGSALYAGKVKNLTVREKSTGPGQNESDLG